MLLRKPAPAMSYLSQDYLCQLLARGRAVEQWLEPAQDDGEPTLKWVCVQREPSPVLTYSVALMEVYDEGKPLLTDLSLLDVDEPEGKISSFENREEALDYVVKELGGSLDKFVREGEIQLEYEKYLSQHSAPPVVLVQNDFLRGRQTLELLNHRVIRISTMVGSDRKVAEAHLASLEPEPQRIRKWNIPSLVLATPMVLLLPFVIVIGAGFVWADPSWSNALFSFLVDVITFVFTGLLVGNAYIKRQNSIVFASTTGGPALALWFNNPDQKAFDDFLSKLQAVLNRVDRTPHAVVEETVEQLQVSIEAETPQIVLDSRYVPALRSRQNWMREWRRPLRTQVIFEYPARFVGTDADNGGVLSVKGAQWFLSFLKSVPDLEVDPDLCQEDWGVVIFAKRNRRKFYIGLNSMDEGQWLAHIQYGWVTRFRPSRKRELLCLVMDLHRVLSLYQSVKAIAWYTEKEAFKGYTSKGHSTPD
jgi:hypothetical protein